jgi:hypothetical protein
MPVFVYCPEHPEASEHGHVEKSKALDFLAANAPKKAPNVISDTMPETRHMADGKYYSSKSEFRKATRSAGCVEVGNDVAPLVQPRKTVELDRRQRREDIGRAIHMLKNGYRP